MALDPKSSASANSATPAAFRPSCPEEQAAKQRYYIILEQDVCQVVFKKISPLPPLRAKKEAGNPPPAWQGDEPGVLPAWFWRRRASMV